MTAAGPPAAPGGGVPPDDDLLADLRRTLATVDPPSEDLVAAGRAAFALRRLDDELAELVADSRTDAVATRDAVALERMLSFTAGPVGIDVQLTARSDGTVDLLGEVDPAPPGSRVVVEAGDATVLAETVTDAGGRFAVVAAAASALRLRVLRPIGPAVTTPWFTP